MILGHPIRFIGPNETKLDRVGVINPLIERVNRLSAMDFDKRDFDISTAGGILRVRRRVSLEGTSELPWEWSCSISGTSVIVTPGDVVWGSRIIEATRTEPEPPLEPEIIPITLDLSAVPENEIRWVYAEINFNTETLTANFTDGETKAVNDPSQNISRRNLACFLMGAGATSLSLYSMAHRGEIHIGGEAAPPPAWEV